MCRVHKPCHAHNTVTLYILLDNTACICWGEPGPTPNSCYYFRFPAVRWFMLVYVGLEKALRFMVFTTVICATLGLQPSLLTEIVVKMTPVLEY